MIADAFQQTATIAPDAAPLLMAWRHAPLAQSAWPFDGGHPDIARLFNCDSSVMLDVAKGTLDLHNAVGFMPGVAPLAGQFCVMGGMATVHASYRHQPRRVKAHG